MLRNIKYFIIALPALILVFLPEISSSRQIPYSESGLYRGSVGAPVTSQDGLSFYSNISVYDPATGSKRRGLTRFNFDGKELENDLPLTGLFSPDGAEIAFRASREGKSGIWIYNIQSKQYRFVTSVPASNAFLGHRANKNFVWSPDGKSIAYVAAEKEPEPPESDIKVITRILYKNRTSFSDNIRTHIFVISTDGKTVRQVTFGEYDEHSIDWSPDGSKIMFISNRSKVPDDNHNNDIWTVDVASGEINRITDTPGTEFSPKYSPDGKLIAYLGGVRPINTRDSPPENNQLWVIPVSGEKVINLTQALDRRITNPQWTKDSKWLFFTANNRGGIHIFRVPASGGNISTVVGGDVRASSYSISMKKSKIVYVQSNHTNPGELWSASLDGKNHKQLTHFQDYFLENVKMSIPETIWFPSFDGTMVQGWLMKPNPFDPNRKYPLILTIHGGPHGAYGFSISGTNQAFAEANFGVLYINPRGSVGYGQKFADGTVNNWGGGDYKDLMAGVDFALEHNDWIDADRLGVTGGSYGGYMTNWVITQTDRFKAAVTVASVSNLISFYGNSLYQLLIETEFPGYPWDNYDLLWHWSPMKHVKNVKTPTLFIHGENDHDVPITQAEEMYIALKKLGVESVFVRYPGEGHGIRRPDHRADYDKRRMDWFVKYLKPNIILQK